MKPLRYWTYDGQVSKAYDVRRDRFDFQLND